LERRYAEAEAALTETYPVLVGNEVDKEMTATVRRWIEDLYRATGKPQRAQAYFQEVEQQQRAARAP
jgi:hypothetical protein